MKDKAEYARKGISRGRAIVAIEYREGLAGAAVVCGTLWLVPALRPNGVGAVELGVLAVSILAACLADAGYRAIAYDQLGFGRSDKPRSAGEYSLERHERHVAALADELALDGVTLVLQDWGGPIGLRWAAEQPRRVRRLVLLNTFSQTAPTGRGPFRWPLTRDLLVKLMHFYVRGFLFRGGLRHPERLGENERAAYLAPHPTPSSRSGILAYTRLAADPLRLEALRGKPVLFVWGLRDRALHDVALRRWQERLPGGKALELEDSASFVPEDAPQESLQAILRFLERA